MARKYLEDALSCSSQLALSYADPSQKWIIRQHLVSLFQDFPSLKPSIAAFTHNNGTTVNLLNASGEIPLSSSAPPVLMIIWLNENYPSMAPLVYVAPLNSSFSVYSDHPFVDSSGATTSSYLSLWNPGCNLSELVRSLVKLFSRFHPFCYSPSAWLSNAHPSFVSKMEAADRLACSLHYDMMALRSKTEDEIEYLSAMQSELEKRADIASSLVIGLEHEHYRLKERVKKMTEESDVLLNWLKVCNPGNVDVDDAFGAVDEKSRMVIEYLAADNAMDDLMYALEKAAENGIFTSFEAYIKQVRSLARSQYFYRAERIRLLQGSQNRIN